MSRKRITEVEREIMKDIAINLRKIIKRKGLTQKELSELTGISTSAISDYINEKTLMTPSIIQLLAESLNVQAKDIQSSLAGVDNGGYQSHGIPLIGTICAGEGLLADSNIEDYVYFPYPNKKQPDYALHVKGDSMRDAGIENGDIVYFRRAQWADYNGQIVAALVNDNEEGMLKKIHWSGDDAKIKLIPANNEFQTKEYFPYEISVCGVYMGHFKPFNDKLGE
ncbi:LexA family protein [Paenibacillus macquariensis]|uniref:Repressor LexA n=1 Tax=Paenibacillus macquariensis TaxID=948756 RepID=A0ABY1KEV0_9BACL|nr:S24 family peptidase [Paenibacillus macquariensis]MEC0092472.1 S24 family peptidase [Paenibacillus macquariensis]OAB35431.1 hypothetical protein PMSM_09245 [Paenibacillus macquariensis subsp. macquariensis]SIR72697.1 repressor LexA [Paenibacillus macquariensis]